MELWGALRLKLVVGIAWAGMGVCAGERGVDGGRGGESPYPALQPLHGVGGLGGSPGAVREGENKDEVGENKGEGVGGGVEGGE